MPNQSTDRVIACDSAEVSAPEGVSRATDRTARDTMSPSMVSAPKAGEDEPQEVGDREHDLGPQRATQQQAQRGEPGRAKRDDHRTQQQSDHRWPPTQGKAYGSQKD